MGTSYVEFRNHGFWTRDTLLAGWLTTLIDEMQRDCSTVSWLQLLISEWQIQIDIDGGCMALGLDHTFDDKEKHKYVLSASEAALGRTPEASRRTGQLFLALLKGEIKTDASSPIDCL